MANQFIYNLTDSWADAGTLFTAIKMNVTDTASNASSLLMDLQVGGTSKFRVNKDGGLYLTGNISSSPNTITIEAETYSSRFGAFSLNSNGIGVAQYSAIYFTNANGNASWQFRDTFITRAAAASFQLGNFDAASPVAQTLQVQSVVAGTTNTAGANFTIKGSAGTGTGAGGSIVFQVAPAGSSGSAQNALATALTIASDKTASFATSVIVPVINYNNLAFSVGGVGGLGSNGSATYLLNSNWTMAAGIVGTSFFIGTSQDVLLTRDAANTLALRNGANAQTLRIYSTYTDASNYQYASIWATTNAVYIGATGAGTSSATIDFNIGHDGTSANDNRKINFGTRNITFPGGGSVNLTGGSGNFVIASGAGGNIGMLQFGGTTSAFPALKRSGTMLQVRLADDSGDAPFSSGYHIITGGTITSNASPTVDISQTWNSSGNNFTAIKTNVTDTASASGSSLMDLQVGGTSKFNVNKTGTLTINGVLTTTLSGTQLDLGGGRLVLNTASGIALAKNFKLGWSANQWLGAYDTTIGIVLDVGTLLLSPVNATTQIGLADAASPVAQTLQVQSVVAGTTNTAGANFTINGSRGTGTGAGGSIIFQVAPAGSSGSSQNPYSTALTIGADRNLTMWGNGAAFYFEPASGFEYFGSGTIVARSAGARVAAFKVTGMGQVCFSSGALVGFTSGSAESTAIDTILVRDGQPNTLALRNGANAQAFNIYNTYTDASNYERLEVKWSGNIAYVAPAAAGTGSQRDMFVGGTSSKGILFSPNNNTFTFSPNGGITHTFTAGSIGFGWNTGSQVTIGLNANAGNSNRNSDFISIDADGGTGSGTAGYFRVRSAVVGTSGTSPHTLEEVLRSYVLTTGQAMLSFGGATSAFPALKRSGTTLQVRLADDSGDAGLQCGTQTSGGVAFNAVGTGNTSIASITNTTTGTLLQVLSSASNPLMTVNDTTTGTIFSVQSNTAATLFQVNDTSTGTLLAVSSNTGADVFTVGDNGAITANGTTVTSNTTPILNLSQTWNNSGQIFTGMRLNATDTASASGSLLMDLRANNSSKCNVSKSGALSIAGDITFGSSGSATLSTSSGHIYFGGVSDFGDEYTQIGSSPNGLSGLIAGVAMTNSRVIAWSSDSTWYGTKDVILARDAANTLALRNGANAQTFRVYNSYTDASNGEWLEATFSGNVAYLQTNKNGTGTIRNLVIGNYTGITSVIGQNVSSGLTIGNAVTLNATQSLTLGAWYATPMLTLSQTSISVANHLLFGTDNTYDIGTSTTSRPRNVYIAGSLVAATKSFDIPHPTKQDMRLRYGSLEGPENGVYVRGKIEGKVIDLPDYWTGLVDEDSITVQLTAIGRSQSPYVVEVTDNKVFIDTENHTDAHCYYFIQAERKDVDKLVVEY